MSRKERDRLTIMVGVTKQELTLVQASELMGVGYRQSKRIWRRYQADGDAGLVHRLRGQPSARRKPPALRALALARSEEERYADFGPTLMAEHLAQGRAGGGSRDVAAVAAGDREADGASPPAKAPAMAGAQAEFWGDGATGRFAPRLVRGPA